METYMAVRVTSYGVGDSLNYGYVYISIGTMTVSHRVSYEDGVKALAQLAKRLGKAPQLVSNYYNPAIYSRELRGWIE